MTFKERLPYFIGGLTIGIIIVIFVFGKKNTSFDYGPNARVLKNIRIKERLFSEDATRAMNRYNIDTLVISEILKKGNADMWNKQKVDDCTRYIVSLDKISLTVKNCESTALIEKVTVE